MRLEDHLANITPKNALSTLSDILKQTPSFHTSWWGERFVSFTGYEESVPLDHVAISFLTSAAPALEAWTPPMDRLEWSNLCKVVRGLYERSYNTATLCSKLFITTYKWRIFSGGRNSESTSLFLNLFMAVYKRRIYSGDKTPRAASLFSELLAAIPKWRISRIDPEKIIHIKGYDSLKNQLRTFCKEEFDFFFPCKQPKVTILHDRGPPLYTARKNDLESIVRIQNRERSLESYQINFIS